MSHGPRTKMFTWMPVGLFVARVGEGWWSLLKSAWRYDPDDVTTRGNISSLFIHALCPVFLHHPIPTSPSCDSARSRTNRAEEAAPRNPVSINFSERLAGSRSAHLAPLDAPSKSSLSPLKIRSLREGTERRPSIGPFPPLLSPHRLAQMDKRERGLPLLLPPLFLHHKQRPFCSMC